MRSDTQHYLPVSQGFDSFYGIGLSNNPLCLGIATHEPDRLLCFVMRDRAVVEQPAVLETLPTRLTAEATGFIHRHAGTRPFFLYYAFIQPHTPLFASERFRGVSARGPYGDAIADIDDAVGQVMAAIRDSGQANNTLVLYVRLKGGQKGSERGAGKAGNGGQKGSEGGRKRRAEREQSGSGKEGRKGAEGGRKRRVEREQRDRKGE